MDNRKETPAARRRIVVLVAASLVLVLGATGITLALGRDGGTSDDAGMRPAATVTPDQPRTPEPTVVPTERPEKPSPTAEPTAEPTTQAPPVDPYALADGTYPTYVRRVNVAEQTVRVDVIQVYLDDAARREARKDGMSWKDSRYLHLYLRNENPLLRFLPVAGDARIEFVGGCVAEDTIVGLKDLEKASTPFTDAFYYDMVVSDGVVVDITQRYSTEGC
jgi:hypothetical protein